MPFGLEVQSKLGKIFVLTPYPVPSKGRNLTYLQEFLENEDKPLLYSLDDYQVHPGGGDIVKYQIYLLAIGEMELGHLCYAAIQAMAEAHIDMFRLCDSGLAVRKEPLK